MNNLKRRIYSILFIILLFLFPITTFAHSGRTDRNGGHHDYRNKSGLGYYHYHCGGHPPHLHPDGYCPYDAKDVIIIYKYKSTMYVGKKQSISYKISSVSDIDYGYITSSDNDVISVQGNTLIAQGIGTSVITINSYNNSKQFTITVKPIEVEKIKLTDKKIKLQVGCEKVIGATVYPADATDKKIEWSSSNNDIATVNNGNIIAKHDGIVKITARASNGISKSVKVKVFSVKPNEIETSVDELKTEITNEQDSIEVNILPSNANNKNFSVFVKNDEIIKINQHNNTLKIFPLQEGETDVVIRTWNGIEKSVSIYIYSIPLESIKIDDSKIPYYIGHFIERKTSIFELDSILTPADCTYKDVKWTTSDNNIIEIKDNSFKIVGTGKVSITCVSIKDSNIYDSIEIVVFNKNVIFFVLLVTFIIITALIIRIIYGKCSNKNHVELYGYQKQLQKNIKKSKQSADENLVMEQIIYNVKNDYLNIKKCLIEQIKSGQYSIEGNKKCITFDFYCYFLSQCINKMFFSDLDDTIETKRYNKNKQVSYYISKSDCYNLYLKAITKCALQKGIVISPFFVKVDDNQKENVIKLPYICV